MDKVREPKSFDECEYFSKRAKDKDGNKCTIWVFKDDPTKMFIKYICGSCEHQGVVTAEYALPFLFNCEKCGEKIKVTPLRGAAKGAKKKPKKKKQKKE